MNGGCSAAPAHLVKSAHLPSACFPSSLLEERDVASENVISLHSICMLPCKTLSRQAAALGMSHRSSASRLSGSLQGNQASAPACRPLCDQGAMFSSMVWRQQKAHRHQRGLGCPEQLLVTIILTVFFPFLFFFFFLWKQTS